MRHRLHERILAPFLLPWIAFAAASLYLKYRLMASGGFTIAAQSLGRDVLAGQGFTLAEKLSFFRLDIVVALARTLILGLAVSCLPKRWRFRVSVALSAALALALYAQFRAFQEVGQFLTLRMFLVAISFGLHEPRAYAAYLGGDYLLVGLAALAVPGLALAWYFKSGLATRPVQPHSVQRHSVQRDLVHGNPWEIAFDCALLSFLFLISLIPWMPRIATTPYHRSVFFQAMSAYWHDDGVETREFAGLAMPELLSSYRRLAQAPDSGQNPAYWSKEKGGNVLYFVLETTPAMFLGADENWDDLPNLRRLRDRSFLASQHHTTFPRTHEAVFSLLSSWYPPDVARTLEEQHPGLQVPGIMRTLSTLGYHTAIYSPMRREGSTEHAMYQSVGVQDEVYPPDALMPSTDSKDVLEAWEETRIARDQATLNLMLQDLDCSLSQGQKFGAVFLPQISHFPYPSLTGVVGETDLKKRSRAVLKVEDAWLGEMLQLLERYHQLDNTVIVVVGDHGLRDAQEDPGFAAGTIGENAFHVPLMIYAGRALDHTVRIPWLTSHIDVAPTILDLLGVDKGRKYEQGTAVWNPELAGRTTYFFADTVFGADGFYSQGRFYMWNRMSDAVYSRSNLHFEPADIVQGSLPMHDAVRESVNRMAGFQQVQTAQFGDSSSFRNHIFDGAATHPVDSMEEHISSWFLAVKADTFRFATEFSHLSSGRSLVPARTPQKAPAT